MKNTIKKTCTIFLIILSLLLCACSSAKSDSRAESHVVSDTTTASAPSSASAGSADIAYGSAESKSFGSLSSSSAAADTAAPAEGYEPAYKNSFEAEAEFTDEEFPVSDAIAADYLITEGEIIITEPYAPKPQSGLLTAGEWNDNENFSFLLNLIASQSSDNSGTVPETAHYSHFERWSLYPFNRVAVHLVCETPAGSADLEGAELTLKADNGSTLFTAVSDNKGMAYLFYNLNGGSAAPYAISVSFMGSTHEYILTDSDISNITPVEIKLSSSAGNAGQTLDLMFVIDTTGSMGDEISYLQAELEDIINHVKNDNSNIPTRLSVNFYRDHGDDYIVRSYPFDTDIDSQLSYLASEYASGGGDYEEAVDEALYDAIYMHEWNADSTKLLFLVLDAPPHKTNSIISGLSQTIGQAAKLGIRIIPIASSGIDKETEFLLRTFAMTTGGTYTFLTDDSGIGGSHIEPTIGDYEVKKLNDLITEIINSYLE